MKTLFALVVFGLSTLVFADRSGTEDKCMYQISEATQISKNVMRFKAIPKNGDCESYNRDEIFVENPVVQVSLIANMRAQQAVELPSKAVPLAEGFSKEGLAEVEAYKAELERLLDDPIYNDPCSGKYWKIQEMLNSLFFAQAYTGGVE